MIRSGMAIADLLLASCLGIWALPFWQSKQSNKQKCSLSPSKMLSFPSFTYWVADSLLLCPRHPQTKIGICSQKVPFPYICIWNAKNKKTLHIPNFHFKNKGICEFWDFQILGLQSGIWSKKKGNFKFPLLLCVCLYVDVSLCVSVSIWMSLSLCVRLSSTKSAARSVSMSGAQSRKNFLANYFLKSKKFQPHTTICSCCSTSCSSSSSRSKWRKRRCYNKQTTNT